MPSMDTVPLSAAEVETEERRVQRSRSGLAPFIQMVFSSPKIVEEQTSAPIAIPIYSIDKTSFTVSVERAGVEERIVSRIGDVIGSYSYSAIVTAKTMPRWRYWTPMDAPTIRQVLDLVMNFMKGVSAELTPTDYSDFTRFKSLDEQFRVAEQLRRIVRTAGKITSAHLLNDDGGMDIVAKIQSMSERNKVYSLVISVRYSDGRPVIRYYCSCPLSRKGEVVCKHFMTVLATYPHVILGSLDYLLSGRKGRLEDYIKHWEKNVGRLIDLKSRLGLEGRTGTDEGIIYYVTKYLLSKGFIEKIVPYEDGADKIERIVDMVLEGRVKDLVREGVLTTTTEVKEVEAVAVSTRGVLKKIVWTPEMEELRQKLLKVIEELGERFGITSAMKGGEWPTLLVYSMVMSSDYTKPPVVLHAVGDIGTFKTTGARLLSEYILIPVYTLTYRGDDIVDKYRSVLTLISRTFGIPYSKLENIVGGLVSSLKTGKDFLEVSINIPFMLSIAKQFHDGLKRVEEFLRSVRELGFKISTRYDKPRVAVVDPAQLSNIEDYRFKLLPDKQLGLLTVMDLFDNHILVIDEGSRNPHGLETLLTKMSISSINEGVRIIIVTDNIEPFQEVISNPRYAPLHDRTYKVMTRAIKDELTVMENLYREPSIVFDQVHLLAAQKFIESIPVPEGIMYLAKAVGNALEYKYTIASVKDGVKHLRPLRRDERSNIEIDVFSGLDFKFISGGRYTYHTIMLAKFFAFLNRHEYVTFDDFRTALMYTVKSRLVVDAETYSDYKLKVMEVLSRIDEALKNYDEIIETVTKFITAIVKGEDPKVVEEMFDDILAEANISKPILAPAVMSALELALTVYNIDIDRLPDNVKYSIIELKIQKGDFTDLEKHMDIVREILRSRRMEVKP